MNRLCKLIFTLSTLPGARGYGWLIESPISSSPSTTIIISDVAAASLRFDKFRDGCTALAFRTSPIPTGIGGIGMPKLPAANLELASDQIVVYTGSYV
ncbi:hypothetical protein BKA93DRAFT_787237 [Sparassis latifolia]